MKICIPTEGREGVDAKVHGHFGSAQYFTIYDTDKKIVDIIDNTNAHHSHGMCHPIGVLGSSGIDAVVCQGMGMRAVQKLNESGIKAYRVIGDTVADVIKKYENNELEVITPQNACAQHGCH